MESSIRPNPEKEIGGVLKAERTARGITLDAAAEALNIRSMYIEAIENNQFEAIPGEVYRIGFLRSYANLLGVSADKLVERYKQHYQVINPVEASRPKLRPIYEKRHHVHWFLIAIPLLIILLIAIYTTFFPQVPVNLMAHLFPSSAEPIQPTAEPRPEPTTVPPTSTHRPLSPVSEQISSETPAPSTGGDQEKSALEPHTKTVPAQSTPFLFKIVAHEKAWLRVDVDGRRVYVGILGAGSQREWTVATTVNVRTGNAGGLEAFIDGDSRGRLGGRGQISNLRYP